MIVTAPQVCGGFQQRHGPRRAPVGFFLCRELRTLRAKAVPLDLSSAGCTQTLIYVLFFVFVEEEEEFAIDGNASRKLAPRARIFGHTTLCPAFQLAT